MPPWPSRWKSSSLAKSKASCSFLAKDSEVNSAASKPDFFGCLCLKLMERIAYYIYVCMYIYITYLILSFVPIVFVVVYCLLSGNQSIYCSCGSKIYQFVLYGSKKNVARYIHKDGIVMDREGFGRITQRTMSGKGLQCIGFRVKKSGEVRGVSPVNQSIQLQRLQLWCPSSGEVLFGCIIILVSILRKQVPSREWSYCWKTHLFLCCMG
jgi:hypothetical protein